METLTHIVSAKTNTILINLNQLYLKSKFRDELRHSTALSPKESCGFFNNVEHFHKTTFHRCFSFRTRKYSVTLLDMKKM